MNSSSDFSKRIERSADGSQTVYSTRFDQHYHSMHGAIPESEHVFITEGLRRVMKKEIKVLEFGFGTGLNALLTLRDTIEQGLHIDYIGIELFPLEEEIWSALDYNIPCSENLDTYLGEMHAAPWEESCAITPNFTLVKHRVDMLQAELGEGIDLVYFDAFGPGTQPELWSHDLFQKIYNAMAPGAVISTYSCKGDVRRSWMELGFSVEKPIGPPGKRSMLVGIKDESATKSQHS